MNPRVPTEISALRRLSARAKATTLNLGLGQPAIDMPPALRALAPQAIASHPMGYTPNAGRPELREAVAQLYGFDPEGVMLCHGAQEGLMATLTALLAPGDEVLTPNPGFLAYPTMVRMAGGEPRPYESNPILQLTERTRAVIVCSPNNPDGQMLSPANRARLESELAKREVFLLSDDVYSELAFREPYRPSKSPFAVTINSWSKSLALTGWRIGFTHTTHPELRMRLLAAHQYLVTCASAPAQALLLEVLRRPDLYRETITTFRTEYEGKLRFLAEALGQPCPEGGFYLFLPVPGSDTACADRLLANHDLLTVPGSYFGSRGTGHLRLSAAAGRHTLERAAELLRRHAGS
jgi:aspartate/methionine/tyrosine aminotransferase